MAVDESNLSETAQKEISKLRSQIAVQKEIIRREDVVSKAKGDTYLCARAKISLESAERKLENTERTYIDEVSTLQRIFEQKSKQLEEQYKQNVKKYEDSIKGYESIIQRESAQRTPTILRAETTIEGLQKKVQERLSSWVDYKEPIIPPEPSTKKKSDQEIVEEMTRMQLAQMTPAERKFFEDSNNRVEEKEEVYMYNGQRVSKFEYELFKKKDNTLPLFGMKKPIKTVQPRTS